MLVSQRRMLLFVFSTTALVADLTPIVLLCQASSQSQVWDFGFRQNREERDLHPETGPDARAPPWLP